MALSVKTVIVRCRWANQSSVADGCVRVRATDQPKPAVGEEVVVVGGRETAPPALCLTSAPVI